MILHTRLLLHIVHMPIGPRTNLAHRDAFLLLRSLDTRGRVMQEPHPSSAREAVATLRKVA